MLVPALAQASVPGSAQGLPVQELAQGSQPAAAAVAADYLAVVAAVPVPG